MTASGVYDWERPVYTIAGFVWGNKIDACKPYTASIKFITSAANANENSDESICSRWIEQHSSRCAFDDDSGCRGLILTRDHPSL
jgi:hypothetical protein